MFGREIGFFRAFRRPSGKLNGIATLEVAPFQFLAWSQCGNVSVPRLPQERHGAPQKQRPHVVAVTCATLLVVFHLRSLSHNVACSFPTCSFGGEEPGTRCRLAARERCKRVLVNKQLADSNLSKLLQTGHQLNSLSPIKIHELYPYCLQHYTVP